MIGRTTRQAGRRVRGRRSGGNAGATAITVVLTAAGTLLAGLAAVGGLSGSSSAAPMPGMAMSAAAGTLDCGAAYGPTPPHRSFTEQLTVPPKVDRRSDDSPVNLVMRSGSHQFSADLPAASTFGYSLSMAGSNVYGGPTIEAMKGRPVKVTVANRLGAHPLAPFIDAKVMGTEAADAAAPRGTVHLHGAHSEAKFDGLPDSTFPVGKAFSYTYGNDQDATGLWYHDHAWGLTRLQVTSGLAGQYWLRDRYDTGNPNNPLRLPTGPFEIPLTIQDRTFNADGSLAYPVGAHCGVANLPADYPNQWSPESFGDVATVNGKMEPNLDVARGVYRFRVLNGSNARFYNLRLAQVDADGVALASSQTMYQIGSDGGLLNAPAPLATVRLAPAERADLLIDFSSLAAGSTWRLMNDAAAPYPGGGDVDVPQIMQFTVRRGLGVRTGIPATLRGGRNQPALLPTPVGPGGIAPAGALQAASTRTVFLNEISDDLTEPPTITGEPVHVMIGNQFYADASTMKPRSTNVEAPAVNTIEEWDIVNTTGDAHPLHLHLTQFRLLNRQDITTDPTTGDTIYVADQLNCTGANADPNHCVAAPGLPNPEIAGTGPWPAPSVTPYLVGTPTAPDANEAGWKDTIVAMPGTVTRIIVPFGGTAAGIPAPYVGDRKTAAVQHFTGTYVFHCHILEHEDNDMMSPLKVH